MRYGNPQNEKRSAAKGTFRRAVTLIEMLIVLFIVSLLAVMALRALPGEDQKPREAARMLNGYISAAKNTTATTGKPAGIILHPWTENSPTDTYPNYSTLVDQCEVPPIYGGDTLGAQMMAQNWTYVPNTGGTPPPNPVPYCLDGRGVIKLLIPMGEFPESLIRYGDQLQVNGQGPIYTICWDNGDDGLYSSPPPAENGSGTRIAVKNPLGIPHSTVPPAPLVTGKQWPEQYNLPAPPAMNGYISCSTAGLTYSGNWVNNYCLTCYLDPLKQVSLPWVKAFPNPATPSPPDSFFPTPPNMPLPPVYFTIIRQPIKSAVTPLQLPAGAGVDLLYSGVDNGVLFYPLGAVGNPPKAGQIGILFSPTGSVEALNLNGTLAKPTQTIYLLIGNMTVKDDVDNNWFDLKSLIISINPQTGTISTNPVYPPYYNENNPMPYANTPDEATYPNQFKPDAPPKYDWNKPLSDPANAPFVQALFYSRKYAREAQTMGGKR